MTKPNKRTNGKRLVSLALLAQLIATSGLTALSADLPFNGGFAIPNALAAAQATTAPQGISLTDSNEFLRYLKRLDTDSGRKAFSGTLLELQTEKEALQRIHDNLVSLVTQTTLSRSRALRPQAESLESLLPAAPLENPSVSDLVQKIQDELSVDALLSRKVELNQTLARLLESNSALLDLSVFEPLSAVEQETLGLLEKDNLASNLPLLVRLRFDAAMTDFWLNYSFKGLSLLQETKTNALQDSAFLEPKAAREKNVLDLIQTLYPTENDRKAQILTDEALELFRSLEQELVSQKILRLEETVANFDQIVSDLSTTFSFDALNGLPDRAGVLREILATLKTEPFSATQFETQSQEYMALAASMLDKDLTTDDFMRRQWEVLSDFEKLLPMGVSPLGNEELDKERGVVVLIENAESALKRQVSAIPPLPVPEPSIEPSSAEPSTAEPSSAKATEVPVPEVLAPEAPAPETPVGQPFSEIPVVSAPLPEAPVSEAPVSEAPVSEAPIQPSFLTSPETTVPVEVPVAPNTPPVPEATQGDFIKSVGGQIPILGSVMEILDVVTNPNQTFLTSLEFAKAPTAVVPSETLKGAAPTEPVQVEPVSTEPQSSVPTPIAVGAETPATEAPAVAPSVGEPVTPATETPATETPAVETPATETPATEIPAVEIPVTEIPAVEIPAAETPATEIPAVETPDTETPATEIPAVEIPVTEIPAVEIPAAETPATEVPAVETPAAETPATEVPAVETPVTEIPAPIQTLPSLQEVSQGVQDFFSEALAVSSAIAQDPGINTLNQAIQANAKTESLALQISGLLDQIDALNVKPSNFKKILDSLSLSADTLDELTSFLNQTTLKLGLADKAEAFSGMNGVLRFGTDTCPDLAKAKALTPENEREGFFDLSSSRQKSLLLKEKAATSDPDFLRLMELRKLGADFCLSVSEDISTKNLIGRSDFTRKSVDSVSINPRGLSLRFENDPSRSLTMTFGQGESVRSAVLRHSSSDEESAIAPILQNQVDAAIQKAVETTTGDILKVDNPADVSVALSTSTDNASAYSLSTLDNSAPLPVPMDVAQREAFQRIVTYEQISHRKNIVTLFTDDAHLVTPRHIDEHTIYNFGTGLEGETFSFENVILRALPDGTMEGYSFDPVAARKEILALAGDKPMTEDEIQVRLQEVVSQIHAKGMIRPDFILAQPFALDKDSKLVEGLGFEITGDNYSQLSVILNVDPKLYPVALHTQIALASAGQTLYDQQLHWGEGASSRFGSSVAIGDFNGDGKKDVAIGSPLADNNRGQVSIYNSSALTLVPEGEPDVVIEGEPLSQFGSRLWSGDLNGDGIDDLAVGSPGFEEGRGRVWIFHDTLASTKTEQSTLSAGKADLLITGSGAEDEFGFSLAFADFTNDGKNDLAIASPGALNGKGSVYVFENSALLKGGSLNAEECATKFSGEGSGGGRFGTSLSMLDYDPDGTLDLAVGAPGTGTSVNPDTGRVYIFKNDLIPWTNLDVPCQRNCSADKADMTFEGESSGSRFGSTLTGGDLNGDGQDDLAVSANRFSLIDATEDGRVYVFFSQNITPSSPVISSREADLKITGQPGDHLGSGLLAFTSAKDGGLVIGDRDCDGNAGCAFIYYSPTLAKLAGKDNGFTDANATQDLKWDGSALSHFSESLAVRDFDGDGLTDFVFGAPGLHDSDGSALLFRGQPMPAYAIIPVVPVEGGRLPEVVPEEVLKPAAEEVPPTPSTEPKPPEFNLQIQDITQAVLETANPDFALDISVPEMPEISCPGFQSGIASSLAQAICSWSDTSGPSVGTFRYCFDSSNECLPETVSPDRSAQTGALTHVHTYLRVQTEDLGGKSEIATFDLVFNHAPVVIVGPSDGGSDKANPTPEGSQVEFSMMAIDAEQNPYALLVCRADSTPLYNEAGEPTCPGATENRYCLSPWTESGKGATCSIDVREEPTQTLIWYAFACDQAQGGGDCSPALQGQGAEGSPVYIQHPQRFGLVTVSDTQGESVEPGDRLRFVLPRTEMKDMPQGSNLTLHICSAETQAFDYVTNECVGGNLVCVSPATNPEMGGLSCDEAGNPMLTPVPTPAGEKEFQAFVEYGDRGLADGPHLQKYTVTDVRPTLSSTINEATIVIPVGGTGPVPFSGLFRDPNGAQDILDAKGVFFDASVTDSDCSPDENNCYATDHCAVIPLSDIDVRVDCTVDVAYNANAGNQWKTHMHVIDIQGEYTDFGVSETGAEVPAMAAINQSDIAIPYTLTAPGEVSKAAPFVLTNLGNQQVDVLISGSDLVGKSGTMPANLQRWSLVPGFDYEKEGIPLSTSATVFGTAQEGCADLNLKVHDVDLAQGQDVTLYWEVFIPKNQKADLYRGTVSFNQTEDGCRPLDLNLNPPSPYTKPQAEPVTEPAIEPVALPAQTVEPVVPAETVVPVETVAPTETIAPTETVVPVETIAPAETVAPVETIAPAETVAPVPQGQ